MASKTPPERVAAIRANLMVQTPDRQIAEGLGVSRSTVHKQRQVVKRMSAEEYEEIVHAYIQKCLYTLIGQLDVLGDGDWLREQSLQEVAVAHGILADKTARLLVAAAPNLDRSTDGEAKRIGRGDED